MHLLSPLYRMLILKNFLRSNIILVLIFYYLNLLFHANASDQCNKMPIITVCEHEQFRIECYPNKIKIHSVFYGRGSLFTCRPFANHWNCSYFSTTDCQHSKADSLLKDHCEDKETCSGIVGNKLFPDQDFIDNNNLRACQKACKYAIIAYYCE